MKKSSNRRDKLIQDCFPLVRKLVAQLRARYGLWTPYDDLIAYGVVGLLEAAGRFEPDRGVTFGTFAYHRIRGAILDSKRKEDRGAEGRSMRGATLLSELMEQRPANTNALSNSDLDDVRTDWPVVHTAVPRPVAHYLADHFEDESAPNLDDQVEHTRLRHRVGVAFAELTDLERRILELHFCEGKSFSDISDELGMTKMQAFGVKEQALERLRDALAVHFETDKAS
jgi:RNA polymerase sigma factor for flagellar operon FliA